MRSEIITAMLGMASAAHSVSIPQGPFPSVQLREATTFAKQSTHYRRQVQSTPWEHVTSSSQYQDVISMDLQTGDCKFSTHNVTGPLGPLNEPLSLHFRGPLNLKQVAIYMPSTPNAVTKRVERGGSNDPAGEADFFRTHTTPLRHYTFYHRAVNFAAADQSTTIEDSSSTTSSSSSTESASSSVTLSDSTTTSILPSPTTTVTVTMGATSAPNTVSSASTTNNTTASVSGAETTATFSSSELPTGPGIVMPSSSGNTCGGTQSMTTVVLSSSSVAGAVSSSVTSTSSSLTVTPFMSSLPAPTPSSPSPSSSTDSLASTSSETAISVVPIHLSTSSSSLTSISSSSSVSSSSDSLTSSSSLSSVSTVTSAPSSSTTLLPSGTASAAGSAASLYARTGYYNAAEQSADGVMFLGNHGGSGSGNWSSHFGNSLSYVNADGTGGASGPAVLKDTMLPTGNELALFTNQSCDGSCGYVQPGAVAYKGFPGATKIFLLEFSLSPPSSSTTTTTSSSSSSSGTSTPNISSTSKIWLLNARIPYTQQYGNCSCAASGCGEFTVFDMAAATNLTEIDTGKPLRVAVVLDGATGTKRVLLLGDGKAGDGLGEGGEFPGALEGAVVEGLVKG